MSTTATTPFAYGDHKVRTTLTEDGEALFVLTDLCRILGLRNSRSVATRLDEDCLGVRLTDTKRGKRKLTFVNEAGMYEVVLRSDKPEARAFRRWITHEVLPTLRRTGTYTTGAQSQPRQLNASPTPSAPAGTVTRQSAGAHTIDDAQDLVPRVEPAQPAARMPMSHPLLIVTGTTTQGMRVVDELMRPQDGNWVSLAERNGKPQHVITGHEQVERYWLASAVRWAHLDAGAQVLASADPLVRARGAGAILTEIVGTAVTPRAAA